MSITLIIVLITVGASFYAWNNHLIYEKWMMVPYRVKHNKEYYRFITSGFIHSGYMHLGFNMLSLYMFGEFVESIFAQTKVGQLGFLALYLAGIVVSDIPTFLKQQNDYSYRSLGASGGVSSVIFSGIMLMPLLEMYLFIIPIPVKGFIFGIIYLIYSYYQAKNSSDNIGHEAHFYGALFGILFTVISIPSSLAHFFEEISGWSIF